MINGTLGAAGVGASLLVAVALVVVVVAFLTHSGRHRAALVACALPLGLVPLTLAVSYGSRVLINAFSGMAFAGSGATAVVTDECEQVWTIVRMGSGALTVVALVTLLLGLIPMSSRADTPACSRRRAVALLVLPLSGALLAAGLVAQLRSALRVVNAVVLDVKDDPARKALVDGVLASEGLRTEGAGSIGDISEHISWRVTIGTLGGLALVVVLAGLSLTGALLAAPVRVSAAFVVAASGLWLVVILAAGAVALGLGHPLRLV